MDTTRRISKAKLKFLRTLTQKKHRIDEGLFVIEGWRSVEEACHTRLRIPVFVYTAHAKAQTHAAAVFSSAVQRADESFEVTEAELAAITETVTAQGVALIAEQVSHVFADTLKTVTTADSGVIVALDRISEPGNAGAIIRSADWFGADAVLLGEGCVDLYNPKVVRSTMGSLFHLPVIEIPEAAGTAAGVTTLAASLEACRRAGCTLYGADVHEGASDIRTIAWARKSVIVFGNEAHGLSPEISAMLDARVMIPQFGKAESLNAAAAVAVVLASIRLR